MMMRNLNPDLRHCNGMRLGAVERKPYVMPALIMAVVRTRSHEPVPKITSISDIDAQEVPFAGAISSSPLGPSQ